MAWMVFWIALGLRLYEYGVRDTLSAAGAPLAAAGGELERALVTIAAALASVVLAVPIVRPAGEAVRREAWPR